MVAAVVAVAAGVVPIQIRRLILGMATQHRITLVDRTGVVEEVGLGAVEVAVGAVGTTGTRRRTLRSFPTCEGINARYVCVMMEARRCARVVGVGCLAGGSATAWWC